MEKIKQYTKLMILALLSIILAACTSNGIDGTYEAEQQGAKLQLVITGTQVKGKVDSKHYTPGEINITGSVNIDKKQMTIDFNVLGVKQVETVNYDKQSNGDLILTEEGKTKQLVLKKVK